MIAITHKSDSQLIHKHIVSLQVSLRIQSECGKIRTRKNSVFGHFSRSDMYKQSSNDKILSSIIRKTFFNSKIIHGLLPSFWFLQENTWEIAVNPISLLLEVIHWVCKIFQKLTFLTPWYAHVLYRVRYIMWYDWSNQAKHWKQKTYAKNFFMWSWYLRKEDSDFFSQTFRYLSARCVVILVEYFLHFSSWENVTEFLSTNFYFYQSLAKYCSYMAIKLSVGMFGFALSRA